MIIRVSAAISSAAKAHLSQIWKINTV